MALSSEKSGKHWIFRVVLYVVATAISVFLSQIFCSKITSLLATLIASAAFTFVFAYVDWHALILPAITFALIACRSGICAAVGAHSFLPVAIALATLLKRKCAFNEAVAVSTSLLILWKLAENIVYGFLTFGGFSFQEFFASISAAIDALVSQIALLLPEQTRSLLDAASAALIIKRLFAAAYITYYSVAMYALCYIIKLLSHVSSDKVIEIDCKQSALTTSRLSAGIYTITLIVSFFFGVSARSSWVMWLIVSLFVVLSPTYMILGAKSYFNFGHPMSGPKLALKIIICVFTIYFGLTPFLLLYFAYGGIRYSLASPAR